MILPIRRVLYVVSPSPDGKHAPTVMFECHHTGKAFGNKGRCIECGRGMEKLFGRVGQRIPVRR